MTTHKTHKEVENEAVEIRKYILDKYKDDVAGRRSFNVRVVSLKTGLEVRVELPAFMLERKKHKIIRDVHNTFNQLVI